MAESAFIIRVPEAEDCVSALRERFDPSAKLEVPAHITVLVPFMAPEGINTEVLSQIQLALNKVPSFEFSLSKVGRFPLVTYLVPEPSKPFVALTESLLTSFPKYPPFRGEFDSIVPHLTVANGSEVNAERVAKDLMSKMQTQKPLSAKAHTVVLLENSSGYWREMHAFPLPPGSQSA